MARTDLVAASPRGREEESPSDDPLLAKAPPDARGAALVRATLEGALARQTDRVALSETVSRSSLLALAEADFEEGDNPRPVVTLSC